MGAGPSVTVLVGDSRGTAEIMLAGHIDRSAQALLDEALEPLLTHPLVLRVEIDVALVDYCDSGGLSAFIRAHQQAADHGVPLYLAQAGPLLRRILDATGLARLLLASA
ncbi:STAS domain-containing protein [Streptacidiphilus cavernicola]|uniref:STAS domain-containing protein n=1 Tax=Streptacidiphilus cavernicola TaxID=3342716 RepID=A0ABV6VPP3_9ACTN